MAPVVRRRALPVTRRASIAAPIRPFPPASSPMPAEKRPRPYVVRNSAIHGRGVFATRKIRKGTSVIEYRGDRTTWDVALERPPSDPDNPHHTFFFEVSDGTVIDANVRGNAARWINHSCDANCESLEYEDGRVFIEARRTIRAGDEITYDYRLSLDGKIGKRTRAAYACHCGAENCRGLLLVKPKKKRRRAEKKKAKDKAKRKERAKAQKRGKD
jgi:SET domain-containing protein